MKKEVDISVSGQEVGENIRIYVQNIGSLKMHPGQLGTVEKPLHIHLS